MARATKPAAPAVEKEQVLPPLTDGELGVVSNVVVLTKSTRAPLHYSEETLLGDMLAAARYIEGDAELRKVLKQTSGLGTSATRAAIIETLKAHKYVATRGKYLVATDKGIDFINWIESVMPELTDVAITARWEADLSVVAEKGGGRAFEGAVANAVTRLVETFKSAPPMGGISATSATTSGASATATSMTTETRKTNPPTPKMKEFAQSIATRLGISLPADVESSFDACREFLDVNRAAALRPSEKQLAFANRIATDKGLTIPAETLAEGKLLSQWIDANK